jgi:putative ABC transport system substrate-binding protein
MEAFDYVVALKIFAAGSLVYGAPAIMRRREFIATLGGAVAWPLAARAQQPAMPVIGFLNSASPGPFALLLSAFHEGLKDGGYVEGKNVTVEYRWADGQYDRLPALAADLVRRRVTVIAATGGTTTAQAAKAATTTVPILFIAGANPVGDGLVSSFNRPGGNVTGVSVYASELAPKRLELLRELVPKATKIAMLVNSENITDGQDAQNIMQKVGLPLLVLSARVETEFEREFISATQQGAQALLVSADPFFNSRTQLVALAARYAVPAAYPWSEYAKAGGLMSYGTSIPGAYRQIGQYVTRILRGEKPADLPVVQPTRVEFILNLKTAKMLDLDVPPSLRAAANELIE